MASRSTLCTRVHEINVHVDQFPPVSPISLALPLLLISNRPIRIGRPDARASRSVMPVRPSSGFGENRIGDDRSVVRDPSPVNCDNTIR